MVDIRSRAVDLVRTLQEDVADKAGRLKGLASAAPELDDHEGADYDMIRYVRVRSVARGEHLRSRFYGRRIDLSLVSLGSLMFAGDIVAVDGCGGIRCFAIDTVERRSCHTLGPLCRRDKIESFKSPAVLYLE